jgi:hypothetical protein
MKEWMGLAAIGIRSYLSCLVDYRIKIVIEVRLAIYALAEAALYRKEDYEC